MNLSRDERLRLIERESKELSVRIQVELLSVNRSGVYYQPRPPSPAEVQRKHRIDEIYTKWPFYGSRKITAQLQLEGMEVNRKAIQRHMREMEFPRKQQNVCSTPLQGCQSFVLAPENTHFQE